MNSDENMKAVGKRILDMSIENQMTENSEKAGDARTDDTFGEALKKARVDEDVRSKQAAASARQRRRNRMQLARNLRDKIVWGGEGYTFIGGITFDECVAIRDIGVVVVLIPGGTPEEVIRITVPDEKASAYRCSGPGSQQIELGLDHLLMHVAQHLSPYVRWQDDPDAPCHA